MLILSWQEIFHLSVWGGLTLAGSSSGTGKRAGKVKLRNSSGARISWGGRETPDIPLSYFFPHFFFAERLWSLGLLHPKFLCIFSLSGKTRKGLDCSAPAQSPLCCQHCFGHRIRAEKEMKGIPAKPSALWCATASGVPAGYLWFMVMFPKGAVCISVF